MPDLTINSELVRQKLISFIHDETTRAGFSHAVVGVSGGVDSALACFLTAQSLGPENVLALRMPYKTSNPDSLKHAQLVIDATGVHSLTIPITEMADPLIAHFPDMDPIRRGNIMTRTRMIILYDQSAAFQGLVVGTGNKTEILLGYTTLYGDSACAFNPIGDLYKAQVILLAQAMGVPEIILQKPPSADLWVGQTDEDELGFTYAEVDRLLYMLVDQHCTPEECVESGFDESFVRAVINRVHRYHFKRAMPPIASLSNHSIDYNSFHLRDWGKKHQ